MPFSDFAWLASNGSMLIPAVGGVVGDLGRDLELGVPMVQVLGDRIGRQRPVRMLVPPVLSMTPKLEAILTVLRRFDTTNRTVS